MPRLENHVAFPAISSCAKQWVDMAKSPKMATKSIAAAGARPLVQNFRSPIVGSRGSVQVSGPNPGPKMERMQLMQLEWHTFNISKNLCAQLGKQLHDQSELHRKKHCKQITRPWNLLGGRITRPRHQKGHFECLAPASATLRAPSLSLETAQAVALRAGPVEKHIEVFGLGQGLLAGDENHF